jgi:DNA mismatch repair ATPase MutS
MTPLRQQYLCIKKQLPDTIVMFRLGDFYETFDDDAKIVSSVCNIVLAGRDMGPGNRVPVARVPYHAVENYLAKLIRAGHKVAILEQTGNPGRVAGVPGCALATREVRHSSSSQLRFCDSRTSFSIFTPLFSPALQSEERCCLSIAVVNSGSGSD